MARVCRGHIQPLQPMEAVDQELAVRMVGLLVHHVAEFSQASSYSAASGTTVFTTSVRDDHHSHLLGARRHGGK